MNNSQIGKKCIVVIIAMLFAGSTAYATGDEAVLNRKVNRMERYIYGDVQPGHLTDRLSRIHKDLLGRDTPQKNPDKTESLFKFLFKGSQTSPSVDMKLNFLEWKIFHENRQGKLPDRLDSLDKIVFGKPSSDPLAFRMEQLVQMTVENGILLLNKVKIAKGTQFKVRVDRPLSSKTSKSGDEFSVYTCDDLVLEKNVLAVPKGGYALGEIDQVRKSGRFGRSGRLRLLVTEIGAIDATKIPVAIEGPAESFDKKKMGLALGASAVGYIALGGPVGLVGGIFVKGKDAEIPEGSEFIVTSIEDVYVNGIVINRN